MGLFKLERNLGKGGHDTPAENHPWRDAFVWTIAAPRLLRRLQMFAFRCGHWRPPGDAVRLSDLEPKFTCQVCGHRGADIRPLFEGARMGTGG
jgi:hypothetical protein